MFPLADCAVLDDRVNLIHLPLAHLIPVRVHEVAQLIHMQQPVLVNVKG